MNRPLSQCRPPRHRALPSYGLTLLEVLVAMTVFSLITATLYGGLRLGARAWDAGEAQSTEADELRLVQTFLRRHLETAYPVLVREKGHWQLVFTGAPDQVQFVTELPPHLGVGGLHQISVALVDNGSDHRLLFTSRLFHPDLHEDSSVIGTEGDTLKQETVLVEGLSQGTFEYFGQLNSREEARWHDHWDGTRVLPKLIRLRLAKTEQEPWPDLVVATRMNIALYQRTESESATETVEDDEIENPIIDGEPES